MLAITIATSALPLSGLAAAGDVSARPETIVVLPVRILDTSGEPHDRTAEHQARLEAMTSTFDSGLTSLGGYNVVAIKPEEIDQACPGDKSQCIIGLVQKKGGSLILLAVVHKSSSLIMQLFARIIDVNADNNKFYRELSFRGDTEDSWKHAANFIVEQIKNEKM